MDPIRFGLRIYRLLHFKQSTAFNRYCPLRLAVKIGVLEDQYQYLTIIITYYSILITE